MADEKIRRLYELAKPLIVLALLSLGAYIVYRETTKPKPVFER